MLDQNPTLKDTGWRQEMVMHGTYAIAGVLVTEHISAAAFDAWGQTLAPRITRVFY